MPILIGGGLAAFAFQFRSEVVVDTASMEVRIASGFGKLKPRKTYPLSGVKCISVRRVSASGGLAATYQLSLDRGPNESILSIASFDRRPDADAEAEALSGLTGLEVRNPATDPRGYAGLP